eukprot:365375-Chlamydomonas_euryale.AAC.1
MQFTCKPPILLTLVPVPASWRVSCYGLDFMGCGVPHQQSAPREGLAAVRMRRTCASHRSRSAAAATATLRLTARAATRDASAPCQAIQGCAILAQLRGQVARLASSARQLGKEPGAERRATLTRLARPARVFHTLKSLREGLSSMTPSGPRSWRRLSCK